MVQVWPRCLLSEVTHQGRLQVKRHNRKPQMKRHKLNPSRERITCKASIQLQVRRVVDKGVRKAADPAKCAKRTDYLARVLSSVLHVQNSLGFVVQEVVL